jgi:ATP-dependent helicase/nuclease subunit B
MAVQFILGRSGTGKTSYCIKAIINELAGESDQPLILLVPEQASYQAERAILANGRIAGYHRLNVLSFDRLQYLLLGKNTARLSLSSIGRGMVIHKILCDNINELKIFGSSAISPGLSQQIAQTIAELHQYAKTPDDIDRLLGELKKDESKNLTALKFADIRLVLREYIKFVTEDFFDPDTQLDTACTAVKNADFIKDAKIWVDGFAGFTESELRMLIELLKNCGQAYIALCLDPSVIDLANPDKKTLNPANLFYSTEQTYCSLIEIIKKNKLPLAKPVILKNAVRFSSSPELAHIERYIFKPDAPQYKSAENICVYSAPNERAEVKFIARQILELVRDNGYRYRDIAVIASNIDRYKDYITAYFNDYDIPFFIDRRKSLKRHPVARLVSSALHIATGNFTNSTIFTYLKTDLLNVERFEIDMLENYCIAFGISQGDWQIEQPWQFAADDVEFNQEQINLIRDNILKPLLELRQKLGISGTITAEQFTRAVFDFLEMLGVRKTLGGWIEQARNRNDVASAEEHQQFYNRFVDIFDELISVFAGRAAKVEDYCAIIDSAFSQVTLALIPPGLDQVLVGSIERSRHPDLKAVFLIGATEKQFPAPVVQDSIFSDADRRAAEQADFALAPATEVALASSQYLAYIAFTRPSQQLYITYPSTDDKGSALLASHFVNELESLFTGYKEQIVTDQTVDIDNIYTKSELVELLCERLGKDIFSTENNPVLACLLDDICSDEKLSLLGTEVLSAINYKNAAILEDAVIKECFETTIFCSATRLSSFAACPYQHFAKYLLEMKERKEFKFEPLDLGNFYHRILDALFRRLKMGGHNFNTVSQDELLRLLNEQIEILVSNEKFFSNFVGRREYNRFVIRSAGETLERFVIAIAQMVGAGAFRPNLSEVTFGQSRYFQTSAANVDSLDECEITLGNDHSLSLRGKIDRIDVANNDNRKLAVIFDYKRSNKSFDWAELYYGLDMQLAIYMMAVRNSSINRAFDAVGAFYLPIETSPVKSSSADSENDETKFLYKAKGLFNGQFYQLLDNSGSNRYYNFYITKKDGLYGRYNISGALKPVDFEKVLNFTKHKVMELAQQIITGKIDVAPYRLRDKSPCVYCKYKPVCRFDPIINGYNFLERVDKTEVLDRAGDING